MARKLVKTLQDRIDAAMASLAVWFMDTWTIVERSWRRPLSRLALRLKYAFYPLLACAALGWLGWDWTHARSLDAAENSIFDTVVQWRPIEPKPSGKTVVVEIDDIISSCGFGVPRMDVREQRATLPDWAAKKGDEGIRDYWREKNAVSFDGLPTGILEDA